MGKIFDVFEKFEKERLVRTSVLKLRKVDLNALFILPRRLTWHLFFHPILDESAATAIVKVSAMAVVAKKPLF